MELLDHVGFQVRSEDHVPAATDFERRAALVRDRDAAVFDVVLMVCELVEQIVQCRQRRISVVPTRTALGRSTQAPHRAVDPIPQGRDAGHHHGQVGLIAPAALGLGAPRDDADLHPSPTVAHGQRRPAIARAGVRAASASAVDAAEHRRVEGARVAARARPAREQPQIRLMQGTRREARWQRGDGIGAAARTAENRSVAPQSRGASRRCEPPGACWVRGAAPARRSAWRA